MITPMFVDVIPGTANSEEWLKIEDDLYELENRRQFEAEGS